MKNFFKDRINESPVARILDLMGAPPRKRDRPQTGDIDGEFDFWFDGGACKVDTGTMTYYFSDGTKAIVAAPLPRLAIDIHFFDGRVVKIEQVKP